MASILLSPSMSAKLKTRDCANRIKHGSPKLQEVLRQRCREEMRKKRGQLFNKRRIGLDDNPANLQETLTEIVRKEFNTLHTSDWQIDDPSTTVEDILDSDEALELEGEIIAETEQWILGEYERWSRNEEDMLALIAEESFKDVICPICQRSSLTEIPEFIACLACGLSLPARVSITDLGKIIINNVEAHSARCDEPSCFAVIPENNNISLYLMCQICSTFELLL
ncbi:uncharacterized protein LOC107267285 [Cephus cinctus]|uniref:Uncharacterized protein LOC107267285 n=1 Tax=Cephus cinctus TaxID=211228 RepID=A0AAJ7BTY1_CEPCN|nr:uncharacterized protein LOC107267285 [Cephus cinctus]